MSTPEIIAYYDPATKRVCYPDELPAWPAERQARKLPLYLHAPPQPAAQGDKEGGDSVLRSALLELTHRKDCEASAVDRQSERLTHLQNLCVGLRIELHPAALSSPPPPAADRGAPFDEKLS